MFSLLFNKYYSILYSGGLVISNERPLSIHAESIHHSIKYQPQVEKTPASFSTSMSNTDELSQIRNQNIGSPYGDHEYKVFTK